LLFVQGRNADDRQFSQGLNEEPRTADVVTCLAVTSNQKFVNIELTFSLAQFTAARALLTTDRTAEMTTSG
jgi:hypothetical protein